GGKVRARGDDVAGKAKGAEEADRLIGDVQFPPAMTVAHRAGIRLVVVMPSLAIADDADEEVVPALFVGGIAAIAPEMRHRVDRPGDMPDQDSAQEHAPDQQARAELQRLHRGAAQHELGREAAQEEHEPGEENNLDPAAVALEAPVEAIAQDILGIAVIDAKPRQILVLDQEPSHMAPEEAGQRAVGILLLIGVLMMPAMDRHPAGGGILQAADAQDREAMLEPFRAIEAAMGEQAVIAEVDAQGSEDITAGNRQRDPGPAEEPGQEGQQGDKMIADHADRIDPGDLAEIH